MGIELFASFFIYIIAFTVVNYRQRLFFVYLPILVFIFSAQFTDRFGITKYKVTEAIIHFPMFLIGTIFADMECYPKGQRPLDSLRDLNLGLSILRNVLLLAILLCYGAYPGDSTLHQMPYTGHETFFQVVTFNFNMPKELCLYMAGIAGMILALTSEATQWLLGTAVFQFFGAISYSLYLIHCLIINWLQYETTKYMVYNDDIPFNHAAGYSFLAYTPVLILVSWLLTITSDEPAKDLANELDQASRLKRNKAAKPIRRDIDAGDFPPDEDEIPEELVCPTTLWASSKVKLLGFLAWFALIAIITESTLSYEDNRDRIYSEGDPLPYEKHKREDMNDFQA